MGEGGRGAGVARAECADVVRQLDVELAEVLGPEVGHERLETGAVEPEDLRIAELEKRCESGTVKEIIIALPSDVEGDATSFYLNKLLSPRAVRMTRIAQGLAVGSGLEFADELTLSRALEGRRDL